MGIALYRKYRSRALSEVVGQEHITGTLARAVKAGRISHAYLFTGPRGVGKTSMARILAHQINDLPYADTPHLDIIEIDAASNRRIDDIRDLREKVHIAPISAKYKVYIIDEVHMLTGESFNALLKTLEEPPAHVVFILATTEVHKLPATIISRAQRFAFRPGSKDSMVAHLKMIAQKENITIDDAALELIAEHGEGSFRDSLSLLDQLTHSTTSTITAQDVTATLGLAPIAELQALVAAITCGDYSQISQILTNLQDRGSAPATLTSQLVRALAAQAADHPALYGLIDQLLEVPRAYNPSLKLLATLAAFAQTIPKPPVSKSEVTYAAATVAAKPVARITHTPHTKAITPLQKLSADNWAAVLQAVKQKNPPLFAVLKQAYPSVDGDTLMLTFKYALHSKKLDDAKQKVLVAEVIQATLGSSPIITVAVNKNAAAHADPAIAAVTAIMGGGEVVDAQTI